MIRQIAFRTRPRIAGLFRRSSTLGDQSLLAYTTSSSRYHTRGIHGVKPVSSFHTSSGRWECAFCSRSFSVRTKLRQDPAPNEDEQISAVAVEDASDVSGSLDIDALRPIVEEVEEELVKEEQVVETLEDHFEKSPPKKKPKRRNSINSIRSSEQTRENAERLFDWVASHTDLGLVNTWSTRLKRKAKKTRIPHHNTVEERVHYVFDNAIADARRSRNDENDDESSKIKKKKREKRRNTYLPPPIYVQRAMAQFFAGNQVTTAVELEEDEATYGPSINRKNWEQNVNTLMRARDLAVKYPLLWSNRQNQTLKHAYNIAQKERQQEDNEQDSSHSEGDFVHGHPPRREQKKYLAERAARIHAMHEWKPNQVLRDEAEALAATLADKLPPRAHDNLLKVFQDYVETENNSRNGRIRILFVHLKNHTNEHVIGIASDVANFFYVDTPDTTSIADNATRKEGEEEEDCEEESSDFTDAQHVPVSSYGVSTPQTRPRTSSADPRLQEIHNKWNESRSQFVKHLLQLYDSPFFQLWRVTPDTVVEQTEETDELDQLVKRREERKQKSLKEGRRNRRRNVHLVFDAIMLQAQWSISTEEDAAESEHVSSDAQLAIPTAISPEKMVFIDNLPIDVEETEIMNHYSRCGPIASVRIFNQRPDLDPGPMSKNNLRKAIKEQRYKFQTRGRWERPRTPLYAAITFATEEGFQKATQDALRIFGMVIRKHPVRSTRASDVTKFFLEGIPPGFFSVDVEHTVSSLLHPHVYVCLGTGFRNYDEPTSCEFRFGSFEAAHAAFEKLERELNIGGEECNLNWLRTPRDAEEYWTRKRGLVMP